MNTLLSNVKNAQKELLSLTNEERNQCLRNIKEALLKNIDLIISNNKIDIENAKASGALDSFIERLTLNEKRIKGIADSIDTVIELPNYIGEVLEEINRPNGLLIKKVRVPFGVIAVIFESRPNVCVDIAVLTLKTANACVLKGGKEAINTNKCLVNIMKNAISGIVNPDVIGLVESTERKATDDLITKREYIDLLIPRGSKRLIDYICLNSKIPYIETGAGNCHLYVEETADLDMAIEVAINAKHQRPSVCNAIENILVDKKIKDKFLPKLYEAFVKLNIKMRGDDEVLSVIPVNKASLEDYYTEYNDYIVAIKVVNDYKDAINHINIHSSKHSESIISNNDNAIAAFFNQIDSACLYHNASTRFTDGGEFGFGAEIGISTGKLHSRGPMGLKEITTHKYIITGNGQVRG